MPQPATILRDPTSGAVILRNLPVRSSSAPRWQLAAPIWVG